MPLLHKKPFSPNEFPEDLKESEEVFFCRLTGEIFRDYDEFCERIILCNSLVWSCSLTGRSHLTFQEAAASEEKVKKLLKTFPMELRIPVLYLASICERRSLVELAEEVFNYAKDRFFIGETVQINVDNNLVNCHILAVVPPTIQELEALSKNNLQNSGDRHYPPAIAYKYEVERHDNNQEIVVKPEQMSRKKTSYSKDKNRLYIKQFVHLDSGYWKLKESSNAKYGISKVKFDQIFCGEPPDMNPKKNSLKRKSSGSGDKPKRQETLNKYFKQSDKKYSVPPNKKPNNVQKKVELNGDLKNNKNQKKKTTSLKKGETATKSIPSNDLDLKLKMKLEKKQHKMRYAEFVKQWNMKREDLECEDLKDLPAPVPVECGIPNEYFGEVVMIMEFLHSFRKVLAVKDFFPNGVSIELMERAFVVKEAAGPLCDIVQLLLSAIFDLRDQEEEELKENEVKMSGVFTRPDDEYGKIIKLATMTDYWVKRHHGIPVSQLTLDASTLSEVLRLHLLTSGAAPQKSKVSKWRYQTRGGYMNSDDPAVVLKLQEPQLIEKLGETNVCDFDIKEKLSIINCLVNQVLTYSAPRDIIEEGCEKARQAKIELRTLTARQAKEEKAEAQRQKELKKEGANGGEIKPDDKKETEAEVIERELRGSEKKKDVEQLKREIREALAGAQLFPLGTDRAHRRFWVFSALPGLFVEDNEPYKGECLPKCTPSVPFNGIVPGDDMAYLKKLFEESGNKENFDGTQQSLPLTSPSKKLLTEKNGGDSPVIGKNQINKNESLSKRALTCWADPVNCPVHGTAPQRVMWSFYKEEDEVEHLINSLNRRGVREKRLKQVLIQEKDKIISHIKNCPMDSLNPTIQVDTARVELRNKNILKMNKLYENANLSLPSGTPLNEVMDVGLRDLILETEEKITGGALGMLKVKDRDLWRQAIQENRYDKQCKKLVWGMMGGDESDEKVEEEENMDVEDIKKEDTESRSSTPSLDNNFQESSKKGFDPVPQRPEILDLASAILQLEQSIEHKYLKRPLGLDPKERERGEKMPTAVMERWETALMESTNYTQLFLHLATLENSVLWERSAYNAFCRICRKRTDPESMLLCDTCNKGHHLYCLKPKLTKVPAGDWHCPRCKPKEKVNTVRRKRKMFSDDSEEEEEESIETQLCNICRRNGSQVACDSCNNPFHLACLNPPLRKIPKMKWICHVCRLHSAQLQLARKENSLAENKSESNSNNTSPSINNVKEKVVKVEKETTSRVKKEPKTESPSTTKRNGIVSNGVSSEEEGELDEKSENRDSTRSRRSRRSLEYTKKSRDLPLDNAALQEILDTLMHHAEAWPFLRPVTKSEVPDYHLIIKKPMDFGTIKHKLNMLEYTKNSELIADAELLFENCSIYNQEGSEVYKAGEKLKKLFDKLCKDHNLQIDKSDSDQPPAKRSRTVL